MTISRRSRMARSRRKYRHRTAKRSRGGRFHFSRPIHSIRKALLKRSKWNSPRFNRYMNLHKQKVNSIRPELASRLETDSYYDYIKRQGRKDKRSKQDVDDAITDYHTFINNDQTLPER